MDILTEAQSPDTSPERLAKLANDTIDKVLVAVAGNPSTPLEVIEKLSTVRGWRVRCAVAKNPITPTDLLEKLANDSDNAVRFRARKRLSQL